MGNILNKLRDYLNQTTPEQRQQDWEALKEWNNVGPFASDYIEYCLTTQQNSTIKYSSVNQKLTVSFIIKYLHTKGLLNEYSAIRARFNGSIRKNTTDINGEIMTPKMTPNSKAKAYIDLKPQIQLCLLDKSIIGEKNYKVIYSSQYEGYI